MITESSIKEALRVVRYPGFARDIVSFGLVRGVTIESDVVVVYLVIDSPKDEVRAAIEEGVRGALSDVVEGRRVQVEVIRKEAGVEKGPIEGVRHIVAVASGKGGVGKSTVTANLAVALARMGYRVGVCDCDLYGPSMGLLFGLNERLYMDERERIIPAEGYGVKVVSMAFLLDEGSPIVVRGPVATRYIQQFLRQVDWGELDYLLLDLPPGTGDIQLTIVQTVPVSGAVIVTTPQEVALIDARKAVGMFEKVSVPVLGLVENMSCFRCPSDGVAYYIFGRDGGRREAERLGVPLLAEIPIDMETRVRCDEGRPIVADGEDESGVIDGFVQMARMVDVLLGEGRHPST